MPNGRNMGWRKPVPRLTPEPSINSPRPTRHTFRRLSLAIVNKDMPPLPPDWRESIETALQREKRHAVYLPPSPPPSPPPKDDTESLAPTLVEEQRDATPCGPPHDAVQPIQCVQRTQASPVLPRRPSQKSLPQIYRPPTPPLPAEYPKLRAPAHAGTSAESVAYTLHSGLMYAGRPKAAPSATSNMCAEKAPHASGRADTREGRRRCGPAATGNEPPEKSMRPPGGSPSPCTYRASAMSGSSGNRSSSGRSYCPGDVCFGVWYVLKGWGVHVRAKMNHAGRY